MSVSGRSPPPSPEATNTSAGVTGSVAAKASRPPSAESENPVTTRSPSINRTGASPSFVPTR